MEKKPKDLQHIWVLLSHSPFRKLSGGSHARPIRKKKKKKRGKKCRLRKGSEKRKKQSRKWLKIKWGNKSSVLHSLPGGHIRGKKYIRI